MADKNKIVRELSPQDLQAFIERLWEIPDGATLKKIQSVAADFGVSISLMAATSFRDTTWARHIERLNRCRELSTQIAECKRTGSSVADAAGEIISQQVFDQLANGGDLDIETLEQLSVITKRMRDGDAKVRLLDQQLQEYQRKELERTEKKRELTELLTKPNKGGITKETLKKIEEGLNML